MFGKALAAGAEPGADSGFDAASDEMLASLPRRFIRFLPVHLLHAVCGHTHSGHRLARKSPRQHPPSERTGRALTKLGGWV